ncbi:MAG: cytochrome ubiquinol oxidase subunit I [Candidatus Latescibacterota bacterium]|jgi:cytochrome d ubiquinol oxidase subunit I
MDVLTLHRFHFAFTVVYHYIFPQITMGLALLIFILKTMGLRGDVAANQAVRFWSKIFGVTFVMGVITGIPMEFQFGTNWARFSEASGGVIGQTLAMEGIFAFFLESSFLYVLLFGEKRLGPWGHWVAALLVFIGTWLSAFFIVCTNAWMQHPVGYEMGADGVIRLESLAALFTNPWVWPQYLHVMVGTTITASFLMASIGAFYLLRDRHIGTAQRFLSVAVVVGFVASALAPFPTGDMQAKLIYEKQAPTFAAMEGHFHTEDGAGLVLIGQPNMDELKLDNPIVLPNVLSFLTHQRWKARVIGLTEYDRDLWPDNVELLYYSYHVMAGLGTLFVLLMALSVLFLWRRSLYRRRWMLWGLMLALPFPFIANTAGWLTAELGRQPWIIYNLMRTADGYSANVSSGNTLFTLIGFMGLYALVSLLYAFLTARIIAKGPGSGESAEDMPVVETSGEA